VRPRVSRWQNRGRRPRGFLLGFPRWYHRHRARGWPLWRATGPPSPPPRPSYLRSWLAIRARPARRRDAHLAPRARGALCFAKTRVVVIARGGWCLRDAHQLWHNAADHYHEPDGFGVNLNATIEAPHNADCSRDCVPAVRHPRPLSRLHGGDTLAGWPGLPECVFSMRPSR